MKKKTIFLLITAILSLAFLPQFISYAAKLFQQPESGWVVWETSTPVQRLAWDGSALWAGHYKGGLSQWTLETGQSAGYTTENGLTGNHVTSIAVDGGGQKWLALLDGSLNLTTDGASFSNLTPAGLAGENAWDVSLSGSEVWLATLGGGVSQYSAGGWTTYNKANSNLPHDDVYALAANGGSPWVGTIGYGVANLQGDTWVSYTLPVQIADPLQTGAFKSNQAVTDIAIDSSGGKWFATDGSGVAVLDSSNSVWTNYNTSNSELSSDFIQRIYIDPQGNYWFGTLGGGVSRLSANLSDWGTFNTANSPLPEDDVLDIAMDNSGGLWLAAYDTGLAYYGALPSPSPEFQLDLKGQPDYTPGQSKGYYLWVNPDTFEWTLAWSGDGKPHTFTGEITANAPFTILQQTGMEEGDSASASGDSLVVSASEQSGQDSVTFKPALTVTEITVRLQIDGAYYPSNIHIGSSASTPGTAPFRIPAIQPQAPVVTAGEDITIAEGEYVVFSADITDPDSPLDHTYSWDFGDGTAVVNTLLADHIYKDEGAYAAQLTVTDIHGLSATDSVTITVENVAPTADLYFDPFEPDAGVPVSFTGSFYDPGELDTHTITWNFGDGTGTVTGQLETPHTYLTAGTYQVAFTVADGDGGTSTANATIVIAVPPTPTSTPTFTPTPTGTETPTPTPTETPTSTSTPASTVYTLVLQPNGTNGVDNYILKSAASTNYGASSDLGIGEKNSGTDSVGRSLIKFDLSSVPADATIVSATLSLWTSQDLSNTDTTVNVYRLKVPFNESQSNWNRSATGVNWQTAGASGANDRENLSIGSVQVLANESLNIEKQISMDPAKVQEMLNGTFTNNGFVLAASGELDDRFVFKSSDSSTATQRPKLVIQYTSQSITPTATITSTSTNTPTATITSTSTPSNTPTATPTGFIFADGFEGGSLSAWSSTSADAGDLSASIQAAGIGSYGMAALLDDAAELRVTDTSPTAEKHYSTRFYLDPNSINLPNGQDVYIFSGSQSAVGWTLCLNLKRFGEDYKLTPCIETDARIWESGKGVYITDAWQSIEMEWQAASAAGANDGYLKLWVNDVLADEIDHIDNDTQAIDFVSIGALSNIPSSLSGTMYFDGFVSYTGAHIGLDVNGPAVSAPLTDLIFKDGFESNDFSLWSSSTTGGGDLSLSTDAAMHATYGMQALVNDITTLYVTDYSPDYETEYRARFQFDPNSITIPSGNGFTILSTGTASGSGYRIMLSSESGVYKLQAQAQNNAENWIEGVTVDTLDAAQLIEVEYKAASTAGADDGYLKLWINDILVDTISNLDNDTYLIDTSSLGVIGSLDAGTSGMVYFDAFESYKTVRSASSTSTQTDTPTPTITAPETPTISPTETAIPPTQIGAIPHPAGGALFAFLPAQLATIRRRD